MIQDPDTFFALKHCLVQKKMPPNVRFREHCTSLDLISDCLPWSLDETQMDQHKHIADPLEFTRTSKANDKMWTLDTEQACVFGALTDSEKLKQC